MIRRTLGFIRFLIHFFYLFIKANLEVARLVLFVPRHKYRAGFVDYSIEGMSFMEALLLSHCITLTPGTITAKFDWEGKKIRIHVLDLADLKAVQKDIEKNLKQGIWRFSR